MLTWLKRWLWGTPYFVTYREAAKELGCTEQDICNLVEWRALSQFIDVVKDTP